MSKIKKYAFADLYEMASGISSTKEQAGHGAPFVSFGTVYNNYFLPDELPDLMDTSEKEQETYSIHEDDILITRTSETIDELAMSCVAVKDYPGATYSGFTKRLRPKTDGIAYSKYLAFYLRGYLFRKAVTNNAFMTLRASFNEDIFSFLNLYLPEYNQQKVIGDLLYKIEKKIQINKKINDNLEQQLLLIYSQWIEQYKYPKHWSAQNEWMIITLSKICDVISGFPFQSDTYSSFGKYRLITIKNVQDSGIDISVDNYINEIPDNLPNYCMLKPMDILMSLTGNVGRIGIMYTNDCLLNQRVAIIKPKISNINSVLYALFKSQLFRNTFESMATGTSQKNLSPIDIGKITIKYNKVIFNKLNTIIEPLLKQIVINQQNNQQLVSLRDWLLPMLMNGQATIED